MQERLLVSVGVCPSAHVVPEHAQLAILVLYFLSHAFWQVFNTISPDLPVEVEELFFVVDDVLHFL
jgi:hypothetical protein